MREVVAQYRGGRIQITRLFDGAVHENPIFFIERLSIACDKNIGSSLKFIYERIKGEPYFDTQEDARMALVMLNYIDENTPTDDPSQWHRADQVVAYVTREK